MREAIGLALCEGTGVAAIGVLGSEFMLGSAGVSLSIFESLAPALAAGFGAGLYRFSQYAPRPEPADRTEAARAVPAATATPQGLTSAG